jgi:hypothetical protein
LKSIGQKKIFSCLYNSFRRTNNSFKTTSLIFLGAQLILPLWFSIEKISSPNHLLNRKLVLNFRPVTISHKIDSESVFYNMTPRDILAATFEIVVTLEGVTEETGNTIQVTDLNNKFCWFLSLLYSSHVNPTFL